jgi:hypothetical protein
MHQQMKMLAMKSQNNEMMTKTTLVCDYCGQKDMTGLLFTCSRCGHAWRVQYANQVDSNWMQKTEGTAWGSLPLEQTPGSMFEDVGNTPMVPALELARILEIKALYLKDETQIQAGHLKIEEFVWQ